MKVKIIFIKFDRQWHSDKYNKDYYQFDIEYAIEDVVKEGQYTSTKNPQTTFEEGKEYDITEEEKEYNGKVYFKIKPVRESGFSGSNYSRKLKQEQARYSSFAVAYCKDLIVADKLDFDKWVEASKKICKAMIDMDKEFQA